MSWRLDSSQKIEFSTDNHGIGINKTGEKASGSLGLTRNSSEAFGLDEYFNSTSEVSSLSNEPRRSSGSLHQSQTSLLKSSQEFNSDWLTGAPIRGSHVVDSMDLTDLEDLDSTVSGQRGGGLESARTTNDESVSEVSMDSALREFHELEAQVLQGGRIGKSTSPWREREDEDTVVDDMEDGPDDSFLDTVLADMRQSGDTVNVQRSNNSFIKTQSIVDHESTNGSGNLSERSANEEVADFTDRKSQSKMGQSDYRSGNRDSADFEVEHFSATHNESNNMADEQYEDSFEDDRSTPTNAKDKEITPNQKRFHVSSFEDIIMSDVVQDDISENFDDSEAFEIVNRHTVPREATMDHIGLYDRLANGMTQHEFNRHASCEEQDVLSQHTEQLIQIEEESGTFPDAISDVSGSKTMHRLAQTNSRPSSAGHKYLKDGDSLSTTSSKYRDSKTLLSGSPFPSRSPLKTVQPPGSSCPASPTKSAFAGRPAAPNSAKTGDLDKLKTTSSLSGGVDFEKDKLKRSCSRQEVEQWLEEQAVASDSNSLPLVIKDVPTNASMDRIGSGGSTRPPRSIGSRPSSGHSSATGQQIRVKSNQDMSTPNATPTVVKVIPSLHSPSQPSSKASSLHSLPAVRTPRTQRKLSQDSNTSPTVTSPRKPRQHASRSNITPRGDLDSARSGSSTAPPGSESLMDSLEREEGGNSTSRLSTSRSETKAHLMDRLKKELATRQQQDDYIVQLQAYYDSLLAKHALAEVTIDQLRLAPKSSSATSHGASNGGQGRLNSTSFMQGASGDINRARWAFSQTDSLNTTRSPYDKRFSFNDFPGTGKTTPIGNLVAEHRFFAHDVHARSLPQSPQRRASTTPYQDSRTLPPELPGGSESMEAAERLMASLMTPVNLKTSSGELQHQTGGYGNDMDGEGDGPGGVSNSCQLGVMLRANCLEEALDWFSHRVTGPSSQGMSAEEEEAVASEMRRRYDKLQNEYGLAQDATANALANGTLLESFDSDHSLEGFIFQLGLRLDEMEEAVHANIRSAKRRTPFRSQSRTGITAVTSGTGGDGNDQNMEIQCPAFRTLSMPSGINSDRDGMTIYAEQDSRSLIGGCQMGLSANRRVSRFDQYERTAASGPGGRSLGGSSNSELADMEENYLRLMDRYDWVKSRRRSQSRDRELGQLRTRLMTIAEEAEQISVGSQVISTPQDLEQHFRLDDDTHALNAELEQVVDQESISSRHSAATSSSNFRPLSNQGRSAFTPKQGVPPSGQRVAAFNKVPGLDPTSTGEGQSQNAPGTDRKSLSGVGRYGPRSNLHGRYGVMGGTQGGYHAGKSLAQDKSGRNDVTNDAEGTDSISIPDSGHSTPGGSSQTPSAYQRPPRHPSALCTVPVQPMGNEMGDKFVSSQWRGGGSLPGVLTAGEAEEEKRRRSGDILSDSGFVGSRDGGRVSSERGKSTAAQSHTLTGFQSRIENWSGLEPHDVSASNSLATDKTSTLQTQFVTEIHNQPINAHRGKQPNKADQSDYNEVNGGRISVENGNTRHARDDAVSVTSGHTTQDEQIQGLEDEIRFLKEHLRSATSIDGQLDEEDLDRYDPETRSASNQHLRQSPGNRQKASRSLHHRLARNPAFDHRGAHQQMNRGDIQDDMRRGGGFGDRISDGSTAGTGTDAGSRRGVLNRPPAGPRGTPLGVRLATERGGRQPGTPESTGAEEESLLERRREEDEANEEKERRRRHLLALTPRSPGNRYRRASSTNRQRDLHLSEVGQRQSRDTIDGDPSIDNKRRRRPMRSQRSRSFDVTSRGRHYAKQDWADEEENSLFDESEGQFSESSNSDDDMNGIHGNRRRSSNDWKMTKESGQRRDRKHRSRGEGERLGKNGSGRRRRSRDGWSQTPRSQGESEVDSVYEDDVAYWTGDVFHPRRTPLASPRRHPRNASQSIRSRHSRVAYLGSQDILMQSPAHLYSSDEETEARLYQRKNARHPQMAPNRASRMTQSPKPYNPNGAPRCCQGSHLEGKSSISMGSLAPCHSCGGRGIIVGNEFETYKQSEPVDGVPVGRHYSTQGAGRARYYVREYQDIDYRPAAPLISAPPTPVFYQQSGTPSGPPQHTIAIVPNHVVPMQSVPSQPQTAYYHTPVQLAGPVRRRSESAPRTKLCHATSDSELSDLSFVTASKRKKSRHLVKDSLDKALQAAQSMSVLATKMKHNLKNDISHSLEGTPRWAYA